MFVFAYGAIIIVQIDITNECSSWRLLMPLTCFASLRVIILLITQ